MGPERPTRTGGGRRSAGHGATFREDAAARGPGLAGRASAGGTCHPASPDLLAGFAPLLSALRWATVCLGLAPGLVEHLGAHVAVAGGVLVAYTLWRTLRPIGRERSAWRTTPPCCSR